VVVAEDGEFRGWSPKAGVKGVEGVDMCRPPHFEQRKGLSDGELEEGCTPFALPALRG
jgi:hypothetical protein